MRGVGSYFESSQKPPDLSSDSHSSALRDSDDSKNSSMDSADWKEEEPTHRVGELTGRPLKEDGHF